MDDSAMDWHPTTPPRPFDPYGDGYMPGGWPAERPSSTAGVFARRANPGFFLPAAKRVCRSIAATVDFLVLKPSYFTVRLVNKQRRDRRNAACRPRPLPHLRESPFRRAIIAREGPIQSYDTVRSTPNPLKAIPAPCTEGASPHRWSVVPPKTPEHVNDFSSDPHAQFENVPLQTIFTTANPNLPPPPTPPSPDTPSSLETMSPRSDTDYNKLNLFRDDVPFPNMRPSGIRMRKLKKLNKRRKRLPTPPDSPSTQLMTDLYGHVPHSDTEDSNVSSDMEDAWIPIGKKPLRKGKGSPTLPRRRYGSPVTSPPSKPAANSPEHPSSEKNHSDTAIHEQKPEMGFDHVEQTPSKSPRDSNSEDHSTPESGSPEVPTTPQSQAPSNASDSIESDISSTVPWSPSHDDPTLYLEDILTPSKPSRPSPAAKSPKTPIVGKSASPTAEFEKLNIRSRPATPEKQITFVSPKADYHSGERTTRRTRAQEARDRYEQSINDYEKLAPLNAEWEEKVKKAVRNGHGRLTNKDFARVVPGTTAYGTDNWLNDETVNEYLNLVSAHGKQLDTVGQVPSHHNFNSFFFNKLLKEGPNAVKRWGTRAKIGGKNLLSTKKVFIPINNSAHWTLVVVSGEEKTITHYNSLPGKSQSKLDLITEWVQNELGSAFNEEEWTIGQGESPMQTNSDDCGVFTVTTARQLMLGFTPMSYGSRDIETQRKRVVAELVNGGLLKAVKM